MRIVIAGAGRVGMSLAERLAGRQWEVALIDASPQKCARIVRSNLDSYCADASDPEVLKDAGVSGANLFFALTDDDEVNLKASEAAAELGANRIIARCENPENQGAFRELGVKTVSPTDLAVNLLEDLFENPKVSSSLHIAGGSGEVVELRLLPSSPAVGRPLNEVCTEGLEVTGLREDSEGFVMLNGDDILEQGDVVVLVGRRGVVSSATHHMVGEDVAFPRGYGDTILVPLLNEGSLGRALTEALCISEDALIPLSVFSLGGQDLLDMASERARERGVNLESLGVRSGNLMEETTREVAHTNPAMVVIDEEEMGVFDRLFRRGESASDLVNSLPCPVLVSRADHRFERMLIPMDGSKAYDRAGELGVELASLLGSEVLAVASMPPMKSMREEEVAAAEKSLEDIEQMCEIWDVPAETRVLEGNPVHQVTQLVSSESIDIVVLGSKKDDSGGLFKSAVGEKLLKDLSVSTLMIK